MNHEPFDLGSFWQSLERLALPVKLETIEPPTVQGQDPPAGARLLGSDYALLLAYPLPRPYERSQLQTVLKQKVEQWFDHILLGHEKDGRNLDGYLLLLMPEKPKPALRPWTRETELDPSLFRRHVLWPEENGSWEPQLERVTVLALHKTPPPVEQAVLPDLPPKAEEVWLDSDDHSPREIANRLLAEARLNEDGEVADAD